MAWFDSALLAAAVALNWSPDRWFIPGAASLVGLALLAQFISAIQAKEPAASDDDSATARL